jgi:hypothetical protein
MSRREAALEGEAYRFPGELVVGGDVPPVLRLRWGRRLDAHEILAPLAMEARVCLGLPDRRRCVPATAEAAHDTGPSRRRSQMATATMAPALALVAELVDAQG